MRELRGCWQRVRQNQGWEAGQPWVWRRSSAEAVLDVGCETLGGPERARFLMQDIFDGEMSSLGRSGSQAVRHYPARPWYSDQGHMVTSPIREHVRNKLRQESAADWSQRAVQGLLPRLITEVFPKSLGATLCSLSTHDLDALVQSECELCASLRQPGAMQAELQQFSKRRTLTLLFHLSYFQPRPSLF